MMTSAAARVETTSMREQRGCIRVQILLRFRHPAQKFHLYSQPNLHFRIFTGISRGRRWRTAKRRIVRCSSVGIRSSTSPRCGSKCGSTSTTKVVVVIMLRRRRDISNGLVLLVFAHSTLQVLLRSSRNLHHLTKRRRQHQSRTSITKTATLLLLRVRYSWQNPSDYHRHY